MCDIKYGLIAWVKESHCVSALCHLVLTDKERIFKDESDMLTRIAVDFH